MSERKVTTCCDETAANLRTELAALRTRAEAAERRVGEMRAAIEIFWDWHVQSDPTMESANWHVRQGRGLRIHESLAGLRAALLAQPTPAGRTDGERLDWLDTGPTFCITLPLPGWKTPERRGTFTVDGGECQGRGKSIREAIDDAMAKHAAMEPPTKGAMPENGE